MRIDGMRFRLAHHEAKHASYGASWDMGITEVYVGLSEGHVAWRDFPTPTNLRARWQRDPEAATLCLRHALGIIAAPYNGERFPGPCPDATMVGELGRAWQRLPRLDGRDPKPWLILTTLARADVRRWSQRPGVPFAVDLLAVRLAKAGTLDGQGWAALWQHDWCDPLRQPAALRSAPAARPARQPVTPTRPTPAQHAAPPDYPLSPWDLDWFRTHRGRYESRPIGTTPPDLGPVPLDWRTGGDPRSLRSLMTSAPVMAPRRFYANHQ
jgi:hypothetical protein